MKGGSLFAPIHHVARLVVEARTPVSIASGEESAELDAPLFRDWNGLPVLSGTSVAGVLRSLCRDHYGPEVCHALFGVEDTSRTEGAASRLSVSFGLALDSRGGASAGLRDPNDFPKDPLLALLAGASPLLRDGVAIGPHGAAVDGAKYDRAACPRGTRFCLDLSLAGWPEDVEDDRRLLTSVVGLLEAPYARFGGATRRGFGRLVIIGSASGLASIDRSGEAGRERWIAFRQAAPSELPKEAGFEPLGALAAGTSARQPITGELRLRAEGAWRIGQGVKPWTDGEGSVSSPLSEPVIVWASDREASVADAPRPTLAPIPGAGVKGAIAHRAEFHLRRLMRLFGPTGDERLMDAVLGSVGHGDEGRSGALLVDDAWVDMTPAAAPTAARRARNSLDRHTQGVRQLFNEETLWRGPEIRIPITLLATDLEAAMPKDLADADRAILRTRLCKALDWALQDLCGGNLALGAGDAVGDGVMTAVEPLSWNGRYGSLVEAVQAGRAD